jgi:Holliday junction resolvasome RuvABC endonuclease subunit
MSQATKKSSVVVMAIFANGRGFGLAVMKTALQIINSYNVAVRQHPISNSKVLDRIKEKIAYYQPKVIVLEEPRGYGSRKSPRVQKLIKGITSFAKSQGLEVHKYSRNDIRFTFSVFNAHSKYEIASVIAENIPSLKPKLPEKRKSHEAESYAISIFDAISLGITHFYQSE